MLPEVADIKFEGVTVGMTILCLNLRNQNQYEREPPLLHRLREDAYEINLLDDGTKNET